MDAPAFSGGPETDIDMESLKEGFETWLSTSEGVCSHSSEDRSGGSGRVIFPGKTNCALYIS